MAPARDGTPIVLTASTIEMAHFQDDPFGAFAASFIPIPGFLKSFLYPTGPHRGDYHAALAPYGLRKVEAMLLEDGFKKSDIAVVHPRYLDHFIGPSTRAIGISTMDPLGLAYVSLTYSNILSHGTEPRTRIEFRNLLRGSAIRDARRRWHTQVIVGGAGAWQVAPAPIRQYLGIDCICLGEAEGVAAKVFHRALAGDRLPPVVDGSSPASAEEIPLIRGGAVHGAVEVTRGCGRGCQFCSPTQRHRLSIPLDQVRREVAVNVEAGNRMIILGTEDLFLYGLNSPRFIPNRRRVVELVHTVTKVPGVDYVQPAHIALAPVCADPKMIEEVAELLLPKARYHRKGRPYVTAEAGVETGSVRLFKQRMAAKALPFRPEDWPNLVVEAFGILNDNSWYPLTTWIIGMPGEKEVDVLATLELLDRLKGLKAFYTPLLFVPLRPSLLSTGSAPEVESLTHAQREFFARCWEYNLDIWRGHSGINSPLALLSRLMVPLGGGLLYLIAYRGHPAASLVRRLLFYTFDKALFVAV